MVRKVEERDYLNELGVHGRKILKLALKIRHWGLKLTEDLGSGRAVVKAVMNLRGGKFLNWGTIWSKDHSSLVGWLVSDLFSSLFVHIKPHEVFRCVNRRTRILNCSTTYKRRLLIYGWKQSVRNSSEKDHTSNWDWCDRLPPLFMTCIGLIPLFHYLLRCTQEREPINRQST